MNDDKNIMKPGNKAIISYDAPFLNSDAIFIEYYDVIKCPWFVLLLYLHDSEALQMIFDTSELTNASIDEMYEWYVHRKERNIFLNFPLKENVLETYFEGSIEKYIEWTNNFLNTEIDKLSNCVTEDSSLNFSKAMLFMKGGNLAKKVYVYTEVHSTAVETELELQYGDNVNYVYGDFKSIVKEKEIGPNSTFVFSDITKIKWLEDCEILSYSSIAIADHYDYNYTKDKKPKVDIDSMAEHTIFKLDYFDNLTSTPEEDE